MQKRILVTGAAGFIGFHTAKRLLERGDAVVGLDNLNSYYDPALKQARLDLLTPEKHFQFLKMDVADRPAIERLFREQAFDGVIHLAAQAGVRYSLENPHAYTDSNVTGFLNILEGCRYAGSAHLVYASTSSVYGANTHQPFSEHDGTNHPVSLYAATKKANELMAHSYAHLFRIPVTGLRFFTVYGPWGRPDMALFLFTRGILAGDAIKVFNNGQMIRDFTYIDDIASGIVAALDRPPVADPDWNSAAPDPASSNAPYRIYNIGNNEPVMLMDFIEAIEAATGKQAIKQLLPMQPGDVLSTHADVSALEALTGVKPATTVAQGVAQFVRWYRQYYRV